MKPASKVKIGVHTYQIVHKPRIFHDGREVDGLCDYDNGKIYISEVTKGSRRIETLIHECLHAIEDSYKINLGEARVNALAPAILALLTDNRRVFNERPPTRTKRDSSTNSRKRRAGKKDK